MLSAKALSSSARRRSCFPLNAVYSSHSRSAHTRSPSPPPDSPPRAIRDTPGGGSVGLLWRVLRAQLLYGRTKATGVFVPGVSAKAGRVLFTLVNAPTQTVVDLSEFLQGAKVAVSHVLEAFRARDFQQWTAGRVRASATATQLEQWCTPVAFHRLLADARSKKPSIVKCEHIEAMTIEHAFVVGAKYDRRTPSELAANSELANAVIHHQKWANDASVERLQLRVIVTTRERTRQPAPGKNKNSVVVERRRGYDVEFLSDVTTPEVVDWRIAAIALVSETPAVKTAM